MTGLVGTQESFKGVLKIFVFSSDAVELQPGYGLGRVFLGSDCRQRSEQDICPGTRVAGLGRRSPIQDRLWSMESLYVRLNLVRVQSACRVHLIQ